MKTPSKPVRDERSRQHRLFLLDIVKLGEATLSAFRARWHVPRTTTSETLCRFRDDLRIVWAEGPKASSKNVIARWLAQHDLDETPLFVLDWTPDIKRIRPNAASFPVALAHAAVYSLTLLRYCQRPNCPNGHYFVARKDQKYCPGACQVWSRRNNRNRSYRKNAHEQKVRRCQKD